MEYQLTAAVTPAADFAELDPLRQHGVAALLDEHLDRLAEIEGPDGVAIEPLDHRVSVHDAGASITWLLDAPALAFAEEAARQVLGEVLARTGLLADWTVTRCEVIASDEDLAAAFETANDFEGDELDTDELDTGELGGTRFDADADQEPLEPFVPIVALTEAERQARQEDLLAAADRLCALGLDAFGYRADDDGAVDLASARYLAGALMLALDDLIDELFADIQSLDEADSPASEHEVLWVLHDLPERYADQYTATFAKNFLCAAVVLRHLLTQPDWTGPRSVAEALALHLLKAGALTQLELADLVDELPTEPMLAAFDEHVFAEWDLAALYGDEDDHAADDASDDDASDDADEDEDIEDDDIEDDVLGWFEILDDEDSESMHVTV